MGRRPRRPPRKKAAPSGQRQTAAADPQKPIWSRPLTWVAFFAMVLSFAALALIVISPPRRADLAEDPAEAGLVTKVESLYNDIYLHRRPDGYYVLNFGADRLRYTESIVNPEDERELPAVYTQSMTVGLAYADNLDTAALIGLGGGRTAWYIHKSVPTLAFTAVELDPEVARIADRYFGVRAEPNFDIAIQDGRIFLARNDDTFDMILVDAYRGPFVPFHLLTTEFYGLVADHLNPGGVAVQNVEPSTMLFDAAVATIGAAFDNLEFFRGDGNIIIVAYDGVLKDPTEIRQHAERRQGAFDFRYDLGEILDRGFTPGWDKDTEPLTDDFAPAEYLKAIARHNEKRQ